MSSAKRAFGAGELSAKAFRKYLMSTSQDGQELHPDDGDDRVAGAVNSYHAMRTPRRKGWLKNPVADYGPPDSFAGRGHIDDRVQHPM